MTAFFIFLPSSSSSSWLMMCVAWLIFFIGFHCCSARCRVSSISSTSSHGMAWWTILEKKNSKKNDKFLRMKECRYGIPFSGRKHLWGLYRVVIMIFCFIQLRRSELIRFCQLRKWIAWIFRSVDLWVWKLLLLLSQQFWIANWINSSFFIPLLLTCLSLPQPPQHWTNRQAREKYRFAKYKKQVEWAITIIERNYIMWKRRHFLLTLPLRLQPSSLSPTCNEWISAPRFLLEASQLLKTIFHRWRVSIPSSNWYCANTFFCLIKISSHINFLFLLFLKSCPKISN